MENISYDAASQELNDILNDLKSESISIDKLAEKVERAAKLATFCSEKLRNTENKVTDIIQKLGL